MPSPRPETRIPCPVSHIPVPPTSDFRPRTSDFVFGGGLHKVEPKELAQIPARVVLESIDARVRIEQQERLFA